MATRPPIPTEIRIRCRTAAALTRPDLEPEASAISLARRVWTETATASQIWVVANPSWKVRLYAAAATGPSSAACRAQTEYARTFPSVLNST